MGEDTRQDWQDAAGHPSTERASVPQAADHLGTTVDAIRKRVQRGTIPHEKDGAGRVWILLDTGRPRHDTTGHRPDSREDLIDELRDRVRFLEGELERRGEEAERLHRIMAGLTQTAAELSARIPAQLEAAPEASEEATQSPPRQGRSDHTPPAGSGGPETPTEATDEQQGRGPIPDAGGPQEATERRWWEFWR